MCLENVTPGYIDPNTSQQIFSLFGPLLAMVAAAGGLAISGMVLLRHCLASYFRRASWTQRTAMLCVVVGALIAVLVIVCRLA